VSIVDPADPGRLPTTGGGRSLLVLGAAILAAGVAFALLGRFAPPRSYLDS